MSISKYYKQSSKEFRQRREELATARAKELVKEVVNSPQMQTYLNMIDSSNTAIDAIVKTTVESTIDPVNTYLDTLRAQGFMNAQIRKLTSNLYRTYIDPNGSEDLQYEDELPRVAEFVADHQELYNTFSTTTL